MASHTHAKLNFGPPKPKPRFCHPLLAQLESNACAVAIKDYEDDLLIFFQELQEFDCPNPKMIDNQPELEWYMRPYLLDFLVELHAALRLSESVLFLAIQLIDRYCSKRIVFQRHYQLVTATSLWLAAKFEEKKSRTPSLKQLVSACSNVYDNYMFIQMESHILTTIHWKVRTCFTSFDAIQLCFLESNLIWPDTDVSVLQIFSIFFVELSCYDKHYMSFSSSIKATAAIIIASTILHVDQFQVYISAIILDFSKLEYDDFNKDNLAIICSPLLRLDRSTHIEIRRCCLLYLNDIFKPITTKKDIPRALRNKYKNTSIFDYISAYTSENINSYLHICKLTQALLNPIYDKNQLLDQINGMTDMMVGLKLGQNASVYDELPLKLYYDSILPHAEELKNDQLKAKDLENSDTSYPYSDTLTCSLSIDVQSPLTPASVFSTKRS